MALYLIGENLDKTRSHYRAGAGKLVTLVRGIYKSILTTTLIPWCSNMPSASPNLSIPVPTSPLRARFFSLPRGTGVERAPYPAHPYTRRDHQDQRLPTHPSALLSSTTAWEIQVDVSSIRQRFLEAFRLRSEQGLID
jgi:serine/threonine-protein kinase HipA